MRKRFVTSDYFRFDATSRPDFEHAFLFFVASSTACDSFGFSLFVIITALRLLAPLRFDQQSDNQLPFYYLCYGDSELGWKLWDFVNVNHESHFIVSTF